MATTIHQGICQIGRWEGGGGGELSYPSLLRLDKKDVRYSEKDDKTGGGGG